MAKIRYYPNLILNDPDLPFTLEVSRSMTVYARRKIFHRQLGENQMIKVDSIYFKKQNKIVVSHKGLKITISGYDKAEKKFVYKIKNEEKPECK